MEIFGISIPLTPILLTALLGILVYMYLTWDLGYWKKRGIPGPKPYPVAGTMYNMVKKGLYDMELEYMKKYGSVVGEFFGGNPTLLISDPEMMKRIMVKDFDHFAARSNQGRKLFQNEELMTKMVTNLIGDEWKRVRNTLTPAFSASKLRVMMNHINKCADTFVENLRNKNTEEFQMKDVTDGFTFDIIARVGFGVELDSQKDPNNPFIKHGRTIFDFQFSWKKPRIVILFFAPPLFRLLNKFFPETFSAFDFEASNYFVDLIQKIKRQREESQKGNLDLIQLMLNAHTMEQKEDEVDTEIGGRVVTKDNLPSKGLSDDEIVAQSFLLMIAGFETTSNTLGFVMYHLAVNPECQEKAQKEVDNVMKDKDVVTYDMTHQFPYLEMCISESMRIFPAAVRTDRECTKEITLKGITIPKGMNVGISIIGRHFDPEVWPEPEKFNPERFTPEAKAERDPINYLPFSYGPRNCIGMRLAQLELRTALARILYNFNLKPCEKTQVPLQLAKGGLTKPKDGIYLKLEPRQR